MKKSIAWKKALLDIYNLAPSTYTNEPVDFRSKDHPIARACNISGNDLHEVLVFLKESELIEFKHEKKHVWIKLTVKGFDTTLNIEKTDVEIKSQFTIIVLTGVLTTVTAWGVTSSLFPESKLAQGIVFLIFMVLFSIVTHSIHKRRFW